MTLFCLLGQREAYLPQLTSNTAPPYPMPSSKAAAPDGLYFLCLQHLAYCSANFKYCKITYFTNEPGCGAPQIHISLECPHGHCSGSNYYCTHARFSAPANLSSASCNFTIGPIIPHSTNFIQWFQPYWYYVLIQLKLFCRL